MLDLVLLIVSGDYNINNDRNKNNFLKEDI